ncbi:hypothetical protein BSLG_009820 [Batrachochytrium salamandrivorans]|nr:hypothetical protein BSLG_009820 [Batrachochytrium salamandrivorans]
MYQFKSLVDPDFMSKPAPPNYIAGLGRGATSFTTRSDIGPARENAPDDGAALAAAQAAAEGRVSVSAKGRSQNNDDDGDGNNDHGNSDQYQDPDQETGLFNTAPYEADDEEADRIYETIERTMDERRRSRRETREREELERYRRERPKIQHQFLDLKRGLSAMSEEEWAAIPEVGDMVRRKGGGGDRRKAASSGLAERYSAVPDSVLLAAASRSQLANSIDATGGSAMNGGSGGSDLHGGGASAKLTDFSQFGQARDKVLGLKLDQVSDSVSGQTTIDPKGIFDRSG